jgi:hypothetical protein
MTLSLGVTAVSEWRLEGDRGLPSITPVACAATVLTAAVAAALAWLGPPGTDLAAHENQRTLFLHHGFQLWNNFWYAGRY